MPSRKYPLISDHFYHVFNRGVNRRNIFVHRRDHIRSLNLIKFYNYQDYPIRFSKFLLLSKDQRKDIWNRLSNSPTHTDILSYCLMPNHFHILLKQNKDNGISKFLADFQNSYARYFNLRYERIGSLFQGEFKAVRIDSEDQLLHVSRYIHLNPYSSALVKDLDQLNSYEWSSFLEYTSNTNFEICKKEIILNYFKNKNSYKNFVLNNADYQKNLESIKHLTIG